MRPRWQLYQGIYIHIPFCVHKCCYCDFASYQIQSPQVMEAYTRRLVEEIRAYEPDLPLSPTATIYFGGGTPSVLPPELLAQIVQALKDRRFWQHPAEATLEANPGTVTLESLRAYRQLGFDRLSMGIQSFQPGELALMGRIHTAEEAAEAVQLAREAGFARISGDLIYGYPTQTLAGVQDSLQKLIATGVDHISVYGLTVEEGTQLERQLAKGQLSLPPDEAVDAMYDYLMDALPQAGYQRYEIANFARPGQESLHNQVYWHYLPYMAFGCGACRFNGKRRETSPAGIREYIEGKPLEVETLTPEIRREELVFMSLRTRQGLNLTEFQERTGTAFFPFYETAWEECQSRGWLEQEGDNIHLTPQGMRFGNLAFETFLTMPPEAKKEKNI